MQLCIAIDHVALQTIVLTRWSALNKSFVVHSSKGVTLSSVHYIKAAIISKTLPQIIALAHKCTISLDAMEMHLGNGHLFGNRRFLHVKSNKWKVYGKIPTMESLYTAPND